MCNPISINQICVQIYLIDLIKSNKFMKHEITRQLVSYGEGCFNKHNLQSHLLYVCKSVCAFVH